MRHERQSRGRGRQLSSLTRDFWCGAHQPKAERRPRRAAAARRARRIECRGAAAEPSKGARRPSRTHGRSRATRSRSRVYKQSGDDVRCELHASAHLMMHDFVPPPSLCRICWPRRTTGRRAADFILVPGRRALLRWHDGQPRGLVSAHVWRCERSLCAHVPMGRGCGDPVVLTASWAVVPCACW